MKTILAFSFATILALSISACDSKSSSNGASDTTAVNDADKSATTPAAPSETAGDVKQYTFHGIVTSIDATQNMITIDHEKIEDYMNAGTMSIKVADPALLAQTKAGDETHFTIRVSGDQVLMTKIEASHEKGEEH